jgi:hypothetical protein
LIDRNASGVRLTADAHGHALLTYRADGRVRHVKVWGAIDARQPSPSVPQVKLHVSYVGGTVLDTCRPYDGPALAWLVTACKAADGSYWAVQSWQKVLPNAGYHPWLSAQTAWELHVSHWRGPLAQLDVYQDWVYGGRFHDLFGRFTYKGVAVHGYRTTHTGETLDTYGRNLFLDTYNSAYGGGWHRENGFVSHNPSGMFCYAFVPYSTYPGYPHQRNVMVTGAGAKYRITVVGPGVTPDIMWTGDGLPNYDPANSTLFAIETQMNAKLDSMRAAYGEHMCGEH